MWSSLVRVANTFLLNCVLMRNKGARVTWSGAARVGGLSMTRAIGCYHLRSQGVIAVPDVSHHTIDAQNDAALVLATGRLS